MNAKPSLTFPLPLRLAILVLAVTVGLALAAAILSPPEALLPYAVKNRDFANYWFSGLATVTHRTSLLFGDPAAYHAALKAIFGADYPWHNWSYPPHLLFLTAPLGMMGYLPAMAVFLGVTLAFYLFAIGLLPRRTDWLAWLLLLPFLFTNLAVAQNGFLTAALAIAGLALRQERPLLAGLAFGLLTIKPQLGILIPFLLIYERNWKAIASALLTTLILIGASMLVFGVDSWRGYVEIILPYQTFVMNELGGDFVHMLTSPFGALRSLGVSAGPAMQLHIPIALLSLLLFGWSLRRSADAGNRAFATILATFLVSPYVTAYDLGALVAFAIFGGFSDRQNDVGTGRRMLVTALAILPVLMVPLGQAGLPLAPILLLAAQLTLVFSAADQPKKNPTRQDRMG